MQREREKYKQDMKRHKNNRRQVYHERGRTQRGI